MPAEEAYVLSPSDVRNIRRYVQHKYAAMPQDKRAEIVADAVSRIIHKQLPPFEEKVKRQVTAQLIRTAVLGKQSPVKSEHIFEACLELDLRDRLIEEPLFSWAEAQLKAGADGGYFRELVDKLALDDPANSSWAKWKTLLLDQQESLASQHAGKKAAAATLASVIPLPLPQLVPDVTPNKSKPKPLLYSILCMLLVGAALMYGWSVTNSSRMDKEETAAVQPSAAPIVKEYADGLPAELRYVQVDEAKLAEYLKAKSSLLAEQPYLDAIIDAAEAFDIHPILLFAITGQEQGFVPKTNKQSKEIANNPFNVFHSWKEYNTTIHDSAEIAARTIVNLSKGRPEGTDPITWINRKYAEDPKWSEGVRTIFGAMLRQIETPSEK